MVLKKLQSFVQFVQRSTKIIFIDFRKILISKILIELLKDYFLFLWLIFLESISHRSRKKMYEICFYLRQYASENVFVQCTYTLRRKKQFCISPNTVSTNPLGKYAKT